MASPNRPFIVEDDHTKIRVVAARAKYQTSSSVSPIRYAAPQG